jgi:5'-deoxynucleotidase YfbR-like HD superfamily hydrolase
MTAENKPPARAWQRMLSGRRLDLLAPRPEDIEIEDIAHGLARVARWNGQTTGDHAFSVAQHSLVVTDIVMATEPAFTARELCAALLHDSPEYVIGDLISPFKTAVGLNYKAFEEKLLAAIYDRFGIAEIEPHVTAAIKWADTAAAYYEATLLAGFESQEAERFFGRPDLSQALETELRTLTPHSTNEAEMRFLDRFYKLWRF